MTAAEALLITALGMAVVFAGLILCIAFIDLFRRIGARLSGRGAAGEGTADAVTDRAATGEPIPADVLAVIAAVLEVERALYVGRYRTRLTLRRPAGTGMNVAAAIGVGGGAEEQR